MRILILNGPNLNTLGLREPEIYGSKTLEDIIHECLALGKSLGVEIAAMQSNHEGALVDWIQGAKGVYDAIILNAGGLTHTSIAIPDALRFYEGRVIEVHLSQIFSREEYRHHSYISEVAEGVMCGFGWQGYLMAIRYLAGKAC